MKVPFLDLSRVHLPLESELTAVFATALRTSGFIGGSELAKFETAFAAYCGTEHCVGVSSGTSAISLPLEALEIGRGDEVIVPANTFFATAEAVSNVGATPVFCDVSPVTFNMTRENAEKCITQRTKAIIGVHLYGQLCDVEALSRLCEERSVFFIEDCAQAHGAERGGKRAGSFGHIGTFSFYPGKNLGALGDGGAVVIGNDAIRKAIVLLREHGQEKRYEHKIVGYNHRLDAMQAAWLRIKLAHLDEANHRRRLIAQKYAHHLSGIDGLKIPQVDDYAAHVFHLFPVFTEKPAALAEFLTNRGIATGFHYPIPCHLQKAYESLGYAKGDFPVSEKLCATELSLPMFPDMTDEELAYVCTSVREFFR